MDKIDEAHRTAMASWRGHVAQETMDQDLRAYGLEVLEATVLAVALPSRVSEVAALRARLAGK